MDISTLVAYLQESLFLIVVLGMMIGYAAVRGTQALTNLILGLYLALLISLEFPYYNLILGGAAGNAKTEAMLMIAVFLLFTFLATLLFGRLMITDSSEPAFENFSNKALYAVGATILVMIFSYHVLPVTEFITPGSPIQYLFGPENNFFWWLLVPLVLLFLL